MPYTYDRVFRTAASEIKSKEVLDLAEDIHALAKKAKALDTALLKVRNKLVETEKGQGMRLLTKATKSLEEAADACQAASKDIDEASQYFEGD